MKGYKQIYKENYKKPYPRVGREFMPTARAMKFLNADACKIELIEIRSLGKLQNKEGEQAEFMDIRIYTKPK